MKPTNLNMPIVSSTGTLGSRCPEIHQVAWAYIYKGRPHEHGMENSPKLPVSGSDVLSASGKAHTDARSMSQTDPTIRGQLKRNSL